MYKEKNINLNKLLQELYPKSQFSSFTSQNSLPKKRTHLSLHNSHYPTLSTQNGITLVALVITIIVLLILAGVTIMSLLSEDGIFERAERAEYETRKAKFEERIGLVNLEAQTQKALNGSLTAEDYFEIVKDNGLISDSTIGGDNIEDKGENTEGDHVYEVTTEDGDVFEVTIDEEGNVETEYQGPSDGLPPRITGIETSKTTNSITVKVIVSRLEGGEISYYIKKASEEEYPEEAEETSKDTSYTFERLEQNVIYDIKVVVENSKGSDEEETSEITSELATGAITQKGETVWNNGEATIELETTETGYTIQYKVGENGQWGEYIGPISGLHHNDKVYVRLWDGINGSGETAITIQDGTKPTVNVTTGTQTTSSIQVSVSSSDGQSGMPTSPTYSYYIKTSGQGAYPQQATHTGTETSYTFSGLTQNTTYDIKVEVADNAGNVGEGSTSGTTGRVAGATEGLKTGNITLKSTSWSNGKASITLGTNTNYMIQYKIGSSGTWTPASYVSGSAGKDVTVTGLSHNSIVYARLLDNANNAGSQASITITDGTAPTISNFSITSNSTTSISVSVSATDSQSGIYSYEFQRSTTSSASGFSTVSTKTISSTSTTYTYTGLSSGPTYYLRVIVRDVAGNTKTSSVVNKTLNTAPGAPTASVSSKTTTSITIAAKATDPDGDRLTYTLYTGTSSSNLSRATSSSANSGTQVTLTGTGLSNYTTYYYRVDVSDGTVTTRGSVDSVRTLCPGGTITTESCYACNGQGSISHNTWVECDMCNGTGEIHEWGDCRQCDGTGEGVFGDDGHCGTCGGSGQIYYGYECWYCEGEGQIINYYYEDCDSCNGTGYVTQKTPCSHGYTSPH